MNQSEPRRGIRLSRARIAIWAARRNDHIAATSSYQPRFLRVESLEKSVPLQKAALLREQAKRALRLAEGQEYAVKARLTRYSEELKEQANQLERQAVAQAPS